MGGWGDTIPLNWKEEKECDEETEDHLQLLWARHWPSRNSLRSFLLGFSGPLVSRSDFASLDARPPIVSRLLSGMFPIITASLALGQLALRRVLEQSESQPNEHHHKIPPTR